MNQARRIPPISKSPFTPGESLQFTFEGHSLPGFSHEPLAIALLANGIQVFGRSIKYHRPRGPGCLGGHCSGCLMRVDGIPNLRTCETLCRSGMEVERQIGWPKAGFDLFRLVDWLAPERLDHHRMFTSLSSINRLAVRTIRKFSGWGKPPSADLDQPSSVDSVDCETLVIGGGISGLAAANILAEYQQKVIVLESDSFLGGRSLDGSCSLSLPNQPPLRGWDAAMDWQQKLEQHSGIEIHLGTNALAIYPGKTLEVIAVSKQSTLRISAKRLLLCNGAYETNGLFLDNDLPGIFGIRALDRLLLRYGVLPGEPLVLYGDSDQTIELARLLSDLKVYVTLVVPSRKEGDWIEKVKNKNIELIQNHQIIRARGGRTLQRLEFSKSNQREAELILDCQACGLEHPESPAYELAHHAGCRVVFDSHCGYKVVISPEGHTSHNQIFAAGHCTGARSNEQAYQQGLKAGLSCLLSLHKNAKAEKQLSDLLESSLAHGHL